jgi:K+-transporting ATPase ATPase B chain
MNRALSANVLAKSGKAVEVAGDVDVLLLDKTGTITHGDRQATAFHPLAGINADQLRDAALLSSLADPTPEGKSIVKLAREARRGDARTGACALRAVHRADAHVGCRHRATRTGARDPQGRRRCHRAHVLALGGRCLAELRPASSRWRARAPRRWW